MKMNTMGDSSSFDDHICTLENSRTIAMAGDIGGPESITRFTSNKSSSHRTLSIFIAGESCAGLRTAISAYPSFLHLDTNARRCLGLHRMTERLYCWRAYLPPDQLTLHLRLIKAGRTRRKTTTIW